MADQIQIVELLVDSAQAVAGAEAVVPPLEEVAVAAQTAAAAVDKLGVSLDAVGIGGARAGASAASGASGVGALSSALGSTSTTAAGAARDLKAAEDAVIKHGAAAGATSGYVLQLERSLAQVEVAQNKVKDAIIAQTTPLAQGLADLRAFRERHDELTEAIDQFKNKGATLTAVLAQWPNLFSNSATGATKLSAAQKELATSLEDLGKGNVSLTTFLEKHPGLLNAAASGTAIFSGAQKDAKAAIEEFSKGTLPLSELISKHPGLMSAAAAATGAFGRAHAGAAGDVRALSPALKEAAAGTEELTSSLGKGRSASTAIREDFVLLHEFLRGDWRRAVGSASIELQALGLLGYVFNPITIAAVAAGAAIVAATVRANTLKQELRSFQTDINFFQPGGSGTPGQSPLYLQGLTQQLIDQGGIGRSNAFTLVTEALQTGLNTDLLPQITQVGKALEKLYGGDSTEWSQKFIRALNGGYEALRKFGLETHTLDAGTIDDLHDIAQTGDNLALKQTAIQAALKSTADVMKTAMTPGKEAAESLGVAWDHALTALANTVPIQKAHDALVGLLEIIAQIAKGPSPGNTVPGGGAIPEGVDQASLNAARQALGLPPLAANNNAPSLGALRAGSYGQAGPFAAIGANAIPGAAGSVGGFAVGNNLTEIVSATLDAVRSAQSVGGFEAGGATARTIDSQKVSVDQNTTALQTLTATLATAAGQSAAASSSLRAGGAVAGGAGLFSSLAQLESGGQNITQRIFDINSTRGTPAQGLFQITDPTWRQFAPADISAKFPSALLAPPEIQQQVVANIPLSRFGPRTVAGLQQLYGPLDTSQTIGSLATGIGGLPSVPSFDISGALGGPPTPGFDAAAAVRSNAAQVAAQQDKIGFDTGFGRPTFTADTFGGAVSAEQVAKINAQAGVPADQSSIDKLNAYISSVKTAKGALGEEGVQAALTNAANQALNDNVSQHITGWAAYANIVAHQKTVLDEYTGRNDVAATQNARAVAGLNSVASAYEKSGVAAQVASAAVEAENKHIATGVDVGKEEIQILSARTAQALQYGAQQINSSQQQLAAEQRLTDASHGGAAALAQQVIDNKAIADTLDVRNKAEALVAAAAKSGTDEDKNAAQAALVRANAEHELIHELDQRTAVEQQIRGVVGQSTAIKDQNDILQLQTSLTLRSASSAEINKQVALARDQQEIDRQVAGADELQNQRRKEANDELLKETARQGDLNIALEQAQKQQQGFNDAIKKAADTIDTTLTTAIANAFDGQKAVDWGQTIRKVIAQILADIANFAFIRPAIGTALGALGFSQVAQQFGSFGGLGGGSSIDPVSGLTAASSGTGGLSLGTVAQGLGGIGKLFGLGGGDSGGGLLSSFTNAIGITASTDVGASIAGTGGLTAQALLDFPATAAVGTGLVSETAATAGEISSALSGAASGIFGAIGSVLPFVGPIIGIGSLIGGLFGNKKPSTFSSGDLLDLTSGTSSGFSSSGNAQNDATVRQMTTAISQFTKNIGNLTGGTAPTGELALVATTKGIQTHYSGELGNIDATFATAQDAINGIELAIAQNLKGVTGTLKTVLSNITDPSQIQAAVTFAKTYDNLSKAAASAFSSISTDTGAIGQFTTALQNIQKTFSDLTTQANQFGLSLDPINAGLAEATKRLQTDFGAALDEAANGGSFKAIAAAAQTFQTNTRDAISIGLGSDPTTVAKIAQVEQVQAATAMAGLTSAQLQTVADKFKTTNPEIATMATVLLGMSDAARAAATSTGDLTSGLKSISDLVTSLRTGQLSGLAPAAQATTSAAAFQAALAAAQAGASPQSLANLSTTANDAFKASQAAYGEGPQTAALRANIIFALDTVLNAPAGSQSTALNTAAVRSAQAAAAALAGANTKSLVPGFALGTQNTPPGAILVGEAGPELIFQQGGASIVPISQHAAYQWRGPSYAGGTGDVPAMLAALLAETAALRRQVQAGQVNDDNNARQVISHTADVSRKVGAGIRTPTRQRLA